MPSLYARTLRQVINDSLRLCNDYQGDGKNGRHWTWNEARTRAQDVLLDMVRATGILKETRLIFFEDGEQVYDLPADCIRILRISINGINGSVVTPTSISSRDYDNMGRSAEGYPLDFYRDHTLAPNQIGFIPAPSTDGSSFLRDSDNGILRRITDEDGNALPFDANRPLRRITGVPVRMTGNGHIIRELFSTYGNAQVVYVRSPEKWEKPEAYPDADIPEFIHKDIKYGVAEKLLKGSKKEAHKIKLKLFGLKWSAFVRRMQRHCEYTGPNDSARPV